MAALGSPPSAACSSVVNEYPLPSPPAAASSIDRSSRCVLVLGWLRRVHPSLLPTGLTFPGASGWSAYAMDAAVLGVVGTCSAAEALLSSAAGLCSTCVQPRAAVVKLRAAVVQPRAAALPGEGLTGWSVKREVTWWRSAMERALLAPSARRQSMRTFACRANTGTSARLQD